MKHPVLQSEFDIYFDHATGELLVWALDKDEAARVWCDNFDARSWVFFNLPADSWVELERDVPSLSPQHPRQCVVFFPDGRSVFIDATQPG
ncbi:MAG TPA: hypothetical protein VIU34_29370 [Steroidobacter sp.]